MSDPPLLDRLAEHARQCGEHGAVDVGAHSAAIVDMRTGATVDHQRVVAASSGAALRELGSRYLRGSLRGVR